MKRWTIRLDGLTVATMVATVEELEEELGPEGKAWTRRHSPLTEIVTLRKRR